MKGKSAPSCQFRIPPQIAPISADVRHWKEQYVGLEIDQVRQLKQRQEENQRLKRLVADLALDKQILQDAVSGKF